MSKFKVGNKVRAIKDSFGGGYSKGSVYEVSACIANSIKTVVDDRGSTNNGWHEDYFELVVPEVKVVPTDNPCIVPPGPPKATLKSGYLSVGNALVYVNGTTKSVHLANIGNITKEELLKFARQLAEIAEVME